VTLYLRLKTPRLSETDLLDCLEMLKYSSKSKEQLDQKQITSLIRNESKKADELRRERLNQLLKAVQAYRT
jgi:hypothetical protein